MNPGLKIALLANLLGFAISLAAHVATILGATIAWLPNPCTRILAAMGVHAATPWHGLAPMSECLES